MTKKDLIKVIRKLVQEEVKKEVGKILISENKIKAIPRKKSKIKPKKKVTYIKGNKSLNVGLTKGPQEEYPDMGGKQYTTGNMADVLGYGDMASPELKRDRVAAQTLAEKGVTPDQVGDGVINALTRDYSGLMKAINKGK